MSPPTLDVRLGHFKFTTCFFSPVLFDFAYAKFLLSRIFAESELFKFHVLLGGIDWARSFPCLFLVHRSYLFLQQWDLICPAPVVSWLVAGSRAPRALFLAVSIILIFFPKVSSLVTFQDRTEDTVFFRVGALYNQSNRGLAPPH